MRPEKELEQHASHAESVFQNGAAEGNRVQVPKVIRWQFKMESEQVLKVTVNALNVWSGWETFYARMGRDGRVIISEVDAETAARAGNRVSQATLWKWCLMDDVQFSSLRAFVCRRGGSGECPLCLKAALCFRGLLDALFGLGSLCHILCLR
jgi:hypothetical protein